MFSKTGYRYGSHVTSLGSGCSPSVARRSGRALCTGSQGVTALTAVATPGSFGVATRASCVVTRSSVVVTCTDRLCNVCVERGANKTRALNEWSYHASTCHACRMIGTLVQCSQRLHIFDHNHCPKRSMRGRIVGTPLHLPPRRDIESLPSSARSQSYHGCPQGILSATELGLSGM